MYNKLEPKQIEKSIIFLQNRDGILDIYFGLMLGAAGINGIYTFMEWSIPWYIRFLILLLLVPILLAKLVITTPRIGYIKMKPVKGGRMRILRVFLLISAVVTILMLAASIFKVQFIHGQMLNISPVILFGAMIVLYGVVRLFRFLKTHPLKNLKADYSHE